VVLDFRHLTRGEQIAGLAGVALLVIMLVFKWYGVRTEGVLDENGAVITSEGGTRNAFQAFTVTDFVLLLTALAAIALPLWTAAGRQLARPIAPDAIVAALGILAFALIAFRLISPPEWTIDVGGGQEVHLSAFTDSDEARTDITRRVGAWLGLVAAAAVAYGGYLSARARASLD
jgi:hypothetical protein